MRRLTGQEALEQLIRAYREEGRLYAGLEEAAAEQHSLLVNGGGRERLAALVERQRQLAEDIGKIESGIAPLRDYWEEVRDSAEDATVERLAAVLDAVLGELEEQVHAIVEIEKLNSRALLREMSATGE